MRILCNFLILGLLSLTFTIFSNYCIYAQSSSIFLGGYLKYLYYNTKSIDDERLNDHILHFRLNSKYYFLDDFFIVSEFRNRLFFGESVRQNDNFLSAIKSKHKLINTDIIWLKNKNFVFLTELDRFYFDFTQDKFQISLGRQRVAWGTSLVWNTTDIFNPYSILDFDYEERPSVDALRLQYFLSEVSKIEFVIKPGDNRENTIYASKLLLNKWNYDFHFIFGVRAYKPLFGFEWAGDIYGAGFRGEFLLSKIADNYMTSLLNLNNKWLVSLVLSADYTFSNTLYLHSEILFNDRGLTNNYNYSHIYTTNLNLVSPSKWSLFQEVSYELHPLLRGSFFTIINPIDLSFVSVPSLIWSLKENYDLTFLSLFCKGKKGSEYGDYGNSFYLMLKYSF